MRLHVELGCCCCCFLVRKYCAVKKILASGRDLIRLFSDVSVFLLGRGGGRSNNGNAKDSLSAPTTVNPGIENTMLHITMSPPLLRSQLNIFFSRSIILLEKKKNKKTKMKRITIYTLYRVPLLAPARLH